jgi:hypothetical protein
MSGARLAYAQARMQARHAERPSPLQWAQLSTSRTAEHFLHAVNESSLARWTRLLDRAADARAVEDALALEFRAHTDEVAEWIGLPWDRAVRWLRWIPLLVRLEASEERAARVARDGGASELVDPDARAMWYARFRALWPRSSASIEELEELVARELERRRSERETAGARAELARELERRFRRHAGTPAAAFAHLALTLLELERLRGAVLVRLLLTEERSAAAWV